MTRQLWPHQVEAVAALAGGLVGPRLPAPAVVLPTGSGKTTVLAAVKRLMLPAAAGGQFLTIVHRTEIVDQLAAEYRAAMPGTPVGIIRGAENSTNAPILVGSVQTLAGEHRRRMIGSRVRLIAVDECHHATAPTYGAVLDHWPDARVLGVTATMTRSDEASLGAVWRVVYSCGIATLINSGRLVRPRGERVRVDDLDLASLRGAGRDHRGDIRDADIGKALEESLAPKAIAKALAERAAERPTIVFAPTVHSAHVIADAVRDAGLTVGVVWGAMGIEARKSILDDYRGRRVQVLVNCMVLTEGTDLPLTSCVVVARPTMSKGLYIQMVGRGLRLAPGKMDCLILDVVGVTKRFGLATPIDLFGDEPAAAKGALDIEDDELAGELDEILSDDDERSEPDRLDLPDRNGPLVFEQVDLFRQSEHNWRHTRAGVPFLPAAERMICVVPSVVGGLFDVLDVHKTKVGVSQFIARGLRSQFEAMSLAESQLTANDRTRTRYVGKGKASTAQINLARRLRMIVDDSATAGEVGELLDVFFGTKRIDGRLPQYMRAGLAHGRH